MNKKINILNKIIITILFSLLVININKIVYGNTRINEEALEERYEKIETDEGTFYKYKNELEKNLTVAYISVNYSSDETFQKVKPIVEEKSKEYIQNQISKDLPEDQKIKENFIIYCQNIYSINNEDEFNEGDDISALIHFLGYPINGNDDYWKENFANGEIYFVEDSGEYYLNFDLFVSISISSETDNYEIRYIGFKPENYDKCISELKETKGIDLENLDFEKILDISYRDNIEPVASSNTTAISASKAEFNAAHQEEISNIAYVIRVICIIILAVFITICIIKEIKKKDRSL